MNATYIYLIIVFSVILLKIKKINIAFRSINTLFHELSHALFAVVLRCEVKQISLNNNASGTCATVSKSRIANFFILLAGYSSCAAIPYVLFYAISKDFSFLVLCVIILLSSVALSFWIKNKFGRIWTLFFIAINFAFIFVPYLNDWQPYLIVLYAVLIGLDNFFSCLTLVKLTFKNSKSAGDSTLLQKTTKIPAIIWSLGFLALSVWLLCKTYMAFLPPLF
ncbi:MAG: M50 family metallopeptidase [Bacteroidales bacterium]|jgi:hypothetical protein|nr:M50 family metallopeptidase [Bacteroidales bacterium]